MNVLAAVAACLSHQIYGQFMLRMSLKAACTSRNQILHSYSYVYLTMLFTLHAICKRIKTFLCVMAAGSWQLAGARWQLQNFPDASLMAETDVAAAACCLLHIASSGVKFGTSSGECLTFN